MVHVLYDDYLILPDPSDAVGSVLVDVDEVRHLKVLGRLFGTLLTRLGNADSATYMADVLWPLVRAAAESAMVAMVLAGAYYQLDYEPPDPS